jgi:type IV pilus assembly protein PilO
MEKGGLSKSFDPIVEQIEKLTRVQRILIFVITFVLILGLFFWLVYRPKSRTIESLNQRNRKLQKELQVAKRNAAQYDKFKKEMKEAETRFRMVMRSLPEKEEIPSLLTAISQSGKETGLEFLLFQPTAEKMHDFYAEIPVSIQVVGDYHNVAVFFDKVARLPRIVNIKDIQIQTTQEKEQTSGRLNTSCKAVTYKFVEEAPEKKAADKKPTDRKGRKRSKK